MRAIPKVGEKQGLGVGPGSATKRWPYKKLCKNIWGNKFSASGVSPKWVKSKRRKRRERERERKKEGRKVGINNGQLHIANATSGGAHKLPGPKLLPVFVIVLPGARK